MLRSPLGDPLAFARSLEQTYRELLVSAPEPAPSVGGLSVRVVRTDAGTELVLPDSLGTVSTFVYLEQRRWFEDEVPFLRAAVGPGDVVVDVGANLGAYTVDLAARVGTTGRVVAFEPSRSTAAMLRASADRNRLTNVTVHQVALGERDGEATLVLGASPELHAIGSDGPGERVPIRSLTAFEAEIRGVRFLKLDAEGSEVAILRGAGEFVRREAPLVMFELKHGNEMNTALIDAVRGLGFEIYQLCPGLGALVPFEPTGIDPYLLNLFGATPETARELTERGLLVRRFPRDRAPTAASDDETAAWMSERPLFRSLGLDASPERAGLPLRLLVAASMTRRSLLERYAALRAAAAEPASWSAGSPLAMLTATRIALDLGRRAQAVALARRIAASTSETPFEPFACAFPSYEAAPFRGWSVLTTAQAIEVEVKRGAFSSFYLGAPLIDLLRRYIAAGGDDEEMDRRLGLCLARARRLS